MTQSRSKKILVLGAGIGQISIILKAKALGHYVIIASIEGNYPGFHHANRIYNVDVKDKESILNIAKNEHIDAILSDQNDIPVKTIGYVCEKLGLTGNNYSVAQQFTYKHFMRSKCIEIGVPSIKYDTAENLDEALVKAKEIGYPIVCKPTDNQSSKGVYKVNNENELRLIFSKSKSASFSTTIIIEKYIEGPEFVIEGMAINSKFKNLLLLDRTYFKFKDSFIPSMVTAPSKLSEDKRNELLHLNYKICTAFGLQNGFSHAEYILNKSDNQFYLVEVAARGGGVYTSSHLLSYACGFDTAEFLIDLALGKKLNIDDYSFASRAARYISFYLKSGKIDNINGVEEIKNMPEVIDFFDNTIPVNDEYTGMKDKSDRLGPILLGANTLEDIEIATQLIHRTLNIANSCSGNLVVWE